MTDIAFSGATELAAAIGSGQVSSVELTDHYIARIERYDGELNAVVVRDFDRAREAAAAADAALTKAKAEGRELGPLHGLPMTIKEAYDITGLPTTWGVPELSGHLATADAESVRRFTAAGAHFLGKTNVPLLLADFQSYNNIYGTTNNPWDVSRGPGGSSGGSAAALAAGFSALEAGSDIGGSIRNPAHFCGVYGHKPTWGIVPPQGHALPGDISPPDIAVVGPMARTPEDLALALDILAGADPLHSRGWQLQLPRPQKLRLSDLRVAVWADDERAPVAAEVAERAEMVGRMLSEQGATVSFEARPDIDIDSSFETYHALLSGVMAAGADDEARSEARQQAATLSPDDRSWAANAVRFSALDHAQWLQMNNRRTQLRQQWNAFFDDWDVLICPITATPAFPHDHTPFGQRRLDVDGDQQDYFRQIFWAGTITVAHLPSTVFPTGPSAEGLPIGLQAVGAEFTDHTTIEVTRLLAEQLGGFVAPPGFE